MTALMVLSKLWFLVLFLINPRLIFIGIGFVVGGVGTLESAYIHDAMVYLQGVYHQVSAEIFGFGQTYAPHLNEVTVEESAQRLRDLGQ